MASQSDHDECTPDAADRWLGALGRDASHSNCLVQERIFKATLGTLRRRRWMCWARSYGALGVAFAAGALVATAVGRFEHRERIAVAAGGKQHPASAMIAGGDARLVADHDPSSANAAAVGSGATGPANSASVPEGHLPSVADCSSDVPHDSAPPLPPGVVDAETWSRLTHQERLSPYERLMRAGDLQFYRRGDLAAAARFYGQAIRLASPDQLMITNLDNWLLMTLKQSRLNEVRHESDHET